MYPLEYFSISYQTFLFFFFSFAPSNARNETKTTKEDGDRYVLTKR